MNTIDISGYWTGSIRGTNSGGVVLDIKQDGEIVTGLAKIHEPALGQYEYKLKGSLSDGLAFTMQPYKQSGHLVLGVVKVLFELKEEGKMIGRWKSEIGTEGLFDLERANSEELKESLPKTNSVFLVHGHDEGLMHSVARFLEKLEISPVILREQLNKGMTIIEKFEEFSKRAGFAVVLMTPDDVGYPIGKEEQKKNRPRQNVILELGYFAAQLGRDKTLVLTKGDIEMPSDVFGLVYEPIDKTDGWKMRLAKELKAAGFEIDFNKAMA